MPKLPWKAIQAMDRKAVWEGAKWVWGKKKWIGGVSGMIAGIIAFIKSIPLNQWIGGAGLVLWSAYFVLEIRRALSDRSLNPDALEILRMLAEKRAPRHVSKMAYKLPQKETMIEYYLHEMQRRGLVEIIADWGWAISQAGRAYLMKRNLIERPAPLPQLPL